MKTKKYKIGLLTVGTILATSVPIVTVISCGSEVVESDITVDLSQAFENAKLKPTAEAESLLAETITNLKDNNVGRIIIDGTTYSLYTEEGEQKLDEWLRVVSQYYPHAFPDAPAKVVSIGNALDQYDHISEIKFDLPDSGDYFKIPANFPEPLEHTHWEFGSDELFQDVVDGKNETHWFRTFDSTPEDNNNKHDAFLLRMRREPIRNVKIKSRLVADQGYILNMPEGKTWESVVDYSNVENLPYLGQLMSVAEEWDAEQTKINNLIKNASCIPNGIQAKVDDQPFTPDVAALFGITNFVPTLGFTYTYSTTGWGQTDTKTSLTVNVKSNQLMSGKTVEPVPFENVRLDMTNINAEITKLNAIQTELNALHKSGFVYTAGGSRLDGYSNALVETATTREVNVPGVETYRLNGSNIARYEYRVTMPQLTTQMSTAPVTISVSKNGVVPTVKPVPIIVDVVHTVTQELVDAEQRRVNAFDFNLIDTSSTGISTIVSRFAGNVMLFESSAVSKITDFDQFFKTKSSAFRYEYVLDSTTDASNPSLKVVVKSSDGTISSSVPADNDSLIATNVVQATHSHDAEDFIPIFMEHHSPARDPQKALTDPAIGYKIYFTANDQKTFGLLNDGDVLSLLGEEDITIDSGQTVKGVTVNPGDTITVIVTTSAGAEEARVTVTFDSWTNDITGIPLFV